MHIPIVSHRASIMDKVPVVDGRGVVINEEFQASGTMSGLMDSANIQTVATKFGVETMRASIFYTNDERAEMLVVGSRLHVDDRRFMVKARPLVRTELPPTHFEVLCEEIER